MQFFRSKRAVIAVVVLALSGIGLVALMSFRRSEPEIKATPKPHIPQPLHEVIGKSVEGRDIDAYTFGVGEPHLLFVGGMHGGYEWNSVLLAYTFLDYVESHPTLIPANSSVTVIPSLNPDGVYTVTKKEGRFTLADVSSDKDILASGRFNARKVDLNRNFDCKWKPEGVWRSKTVSAGGAPFSEPEAEALRDFVQKNKPSAVIFWHSQADAVYASECEKGILPATLQVMNAYSRASGYPAVKSFDSYEVTGDAEGWLASIGVPAVTVELSTHETIEWERNFSGIKALFDYYRQKQENLTE